MLQTDLAQKAGVVKACITDYKKGKSFPSIQTLRLLCEALEVSADYLLGLENEDGSKKYR